MSNYDIWKSDTGDAPDGGQVPWDEECFGNGYVLEQDPDDGGSVRADCGTCERRREKARIAHNETTHNEPMCTDELCETSCYRDDADF